MAFKLYRGEPDLREFVINGSAVITIGDAVCMSATGGEDSLRPAVAAQPIVGFVHDIRQLDGRAPADNGAAGTFTDTYTAAANNETVAKISCLVDVSMQTMYSAASSATPGTTTGSDKAGYTMELSDETSVDESSALVSPANAQQLMGFGVDPEDASRILVKIAESEFTL